MIDGFIPYYQGSLDEKFDKENLRILAWQTKDKEAASGPGLTDYLTTPAILNSATITKHPLIILFLDLKTTTPSAGECHTHTNIQITHAAAKRPGASTRMSSIWAGIWAGHVYPDKEPDRICIHVRGHSKKEYPLLEFYGCEEDLGLVLTQQFKHPKGFEAMETYEQMHMTEIRSPGVDKWNR